MTEQQTSLYQKILDFEIDEKPGMAQPFAARLARENRWTRVYAERVIREYRRYLLLASTIGRPMTPSEEVDQAWHLHLVYTRSYWSRLCTEVLPRPIHHIPTEGGESESDRHLAQYADTLNAYRQTFGEEAPADIWPPAEIRFGPEADGIRVTPATHLVLPRKEVKQTAITMLASLALFASLGCIGGGNPFDLVGVDFLVFFIPLLIAAYTFGWFYRKWQYGPGWDENQGDPQLSWQQLAYLSGGKRRLLTATIARLFEAKALYIDDDTIKANVNVAPPQSPVELAVWQYLPIKRNEPASMKIVTEAVEGAFAQEIQTMTDAGWLMTPERAASICKRAAMPILLVLVCLGLPRLCFGILGGKSVGFLVVTLIVASLATLVLMFARVLTTRLGADLVKRLQIRLASLKTGNVSGDAAMGVAAPVAMGVALFGTAALVGTQYDPLRKWYPHGGATSNSGCGAGCNSGGGGGCGGGGGGCGGGGDGGGGGGGCGGCGGGGGD